MKTGLHNTAIKKDASTIFETNSLQPINFELETDIQPVVAVEPTLISRSLNVAGTLFTTPSDRDFFLTSIAVSAEIDPASGSGSSYIEYTNADGISALFGCLVASGVVDGGSTNSNSIVFPKRGILLTKGSAITATSSASGAFFHITGYYGSDRSR